jgi:hypothetical protein
MATYPAALGGAESIAVGTPWGKRRLMRMIYPRNMRGPLSRTAGVRRFIPSG